MSAVKIRRPPIITMILSTINDMSCAQIRKLIFFLDHFKPTSRVNIRMIISNSLADDIGSMFLCNHVEYCMLGLSGMRAFLHKSLYIFNTSSWLILYDSKLIIHFADLDKLISLLSLITVGGSVNHCNILLIISL